MSPKAKAVDLYNKYWPLTTDDAFTKQCVLIAVDELIKIENAFDQYYPQDNYWVQVKEQIQSM